MVSSSFIRRLEAMEKNIVRNPPVTALAWTSGLAARIEAALKETGNEKNVLTVHIRFRDAEAEEEWERELMRDNPKEAARLKTLLQGQIPLP
jgi:hypothetical protein